VEVMNSGIKLKKEFSGRKVLITGNTGFKGSWLTYWILQLGAEVAGYSDEEKTTPSLYEELGLSNQITQYTGDITDLDLLRNSIEEFRPDFIFHLAAQSIVSTSIDSPLKTFQTNTLGTITLLEIIRITDFEGVAILITSDKCYENDERMSGYIETDRMGGKDPYSASKGAAELAISAYLRTFFSNDHPARIGIGRAGNVIGGGDWNENRIIVDCVKAWRSGKPVSLRNPDSTRPWQHVLEPLSGYLQLAARLSQGTIKSGEAFNFGPKSDQIFTVYEIVQTLSSYWPNCPGVLETRTKKFVPGTEAVLLSLECDKALRELGWQSSLDISECLALTSEWYLAHGEKLDLRELTSKQITFFESKFELAN
jgi:CDP-glucose 4,6-dehydratase